MREDKEIVAVLNEAIAWECKICGRTMAELSGMISHLFVDHRVSALSKDGSMIRGELNL